MKYHKGKAQFCWAHLERALLGIAEFTKSSAVEPTNNSAERALLIAMQMRKVFFGNRSVAGELAIARPLDISETCDKQDSNILAYLSGAILSRRRCQAAPSVLPSSPPELFLRVAIMNDVEANNRAVLPLLTIFNRYGIEPRRIDETERIVQA